MYVSCVSINSFTTVPIIVCFIDSQQLQYALHIALYDMQAGSQSMSRIGCAAAISSVEGAGGEDDRARGWRAARAVHGNVLTISMCLFVFSARVLQHDYMGLTTSRVVFVTVKVVDCQDTCLLCELYRRVPVFSRSPT